MLSRLRALFGQGVVVCGPDACLEELEERIVLDAAAGEALVDWDSGPDENGVYHDTATYDDGGTQVTTHYYTDDPSDPGYYFAFTPETVGADTGQWEDESSGD